MNWVKNITHAQAAIKLFRGLNKTYSGKVGRTAYALIFCTTCPEAPVESATI